MVREPPFSESDFCTVLTQGHISSERISHLWNPNLVQNSGKQILDGRILDPNSWVESFAPIFASKRGQLKSSPSRNSPPNVSSLSVRDPHFLSFILPELIRNVVCTHKGTKIASLPNQENGVACDKPLVLVLSKTPKIERCRYPLRCSAAPDLKVEVRENVISRNLVRFVQTSQDPKDEEEE